MEAKVINVVRKNRYGLEYCFETLFERDNLLIQEYYFIGNQPNFWRTTFQTTENTNQDQIYYMVDPEGGPGISIGTYNQETGLTISAILKSDKGYYLIWQKNE